jgi:maltose alpha-D-glucosyltransferase/alpha-amylase
VLALRYDWRNNAVLCLHNLVAEPREVSFATGLDGDGRNLIDLLTGQRSLADDDGRHCVLLEGYGYRWYRVGGLDYLLRRCEI